MKILARYRLRAGRRAQCIASIIFLICISLLNAQEESNEGALQFSYGLPLNLILTSEFVDASLLPHVTLGTHVQSLGIHLNSTIRLPQVPVAENFSFFLQGAYFYSFVNVGIPLPSHSFFVSGAVVLSVGEEGRFLNPHIPVGAFSHNIVYQYQYFGDTINTSQASGIVGYYYTQSDWLLGITIENDFLAFLDQDHYRTAALEIVSLFSTNNFLWGIALGLKMWTGNTDYSNFEERRRTHRGMPIDISSREVIGALNRHGILYLAGYFESFKLSVGIDAEEIRDLFQNNFHYFINSSPYSYLASAPRFYIQFEVNPRYSIY